MKKFMNTYIKQVLLATALVLSLAFVMQAKADQPECVVNYFTVSPQPISSGSSAMISWTTSNCNEISIYGGSINNSTNLPSSGSLTTNPLYGTTTFTINASGIYNYAPVQSATAVVSNQYGNSGQYYSNSPYTYNPTYQTYVPCVVSSLTASPTSVTSGGSTTLSWTTSAGCTSVSLTGPNISSTNLALSGSTSTGSLYGPSTYMLTATGDNSNANYNNYYPYSYPNSTVDSKSLMILVSQPTPGNSVVTTTPATSTFSVVTGTPTDIRSTSARLNGYIDQSVASNASIFFQWGTDQSFTTATPVQSTGAVVSTSFFDTLFNLYPNTTYYYRAAATTSSGTVYGSVHSFSTTSVPVVTVVNTLAPKPTVTTGVGSGSNLVSFGITSSSPNVCVGDMINYTVTYQNISGNVLNNAVIQVVLPTDVDFQTATPGIFNKADHTVTLALGTLAPNQTSTMVISGAVTKSATNENLIVANATIAFTNSVNNSQESAIAYALNNTASCQAAATTGSTNDTSNVAGLALFSGGFWPTTLIGWLIVILALIGLVSMGTMLFGDSRRMIAMPAAKKNGNGNGYDGGNNNINRYEPPHTPIPQAPQYEDMNIPTYEEGE